MPNKNEETPEKEVEEEVNTQSRNILVILVVIIVGHVSYTQCSQALIAQEVEKRESQEKLQKRNILYGAIGRDLFFRFSSRLSSMGSFFLCHFYGVYFN